MKYCSCCGNRVREELHEGIKRYVCEACEAVYYDNPKPCVASVIMDGQKVLLTKRAIEPGLDKWDLVGGFLDQGEDPETALRREVKEELGVDVSWCRFFGFYMDAYGEDGDSTLNMAYLCKLDGEPRVNTHEFREMRWFSLSELPGEYAFKMVREVLEDFRRLIETEGSDWSPGV